MISKQTDSVESETTITTIDENGSLNETAEVSEALSASEEAVGQDSASKRKTRSDAKALGNVVVAIDPGHGGGDPGASANGVVEKVVNLKIAQYCRDELQQYNGVSVYMTRDTDMRPASPESADLDARVNGAVSHGANVFVSIHNNSAAASAHGFEIYYQNQSWKPDLSNEGKSLALKIQSKLAALGLYDRGIKIKNTVEDTYENGELQDWYGLLRRCKVAGIPALIVEHAFLTNAEDAAKLKDENFLRQLGVADAQAIAEHYGLSKGWWEFQANGTWKYALGQGKYAADTWMYIDGKRYRFDSNGIMQTGLIKDNGETYYLNSSGAMQTGWQEVSGDRYYFSANGAAHRGWLFLGGDWYYLNPQSSIMATGWLKLGNDTFYLSDSGNMCTGYKNIDGYFYAFDQNGFMQIGWYYINGANRYFHDDGKMATGRTEINGAIHYFDSNGISATGWIKNGDDWLYINVSGSPHTGWLNLSGIWYYLDPSNEGVMVTGIQIINGSKYSFNGSGAMATGWWSHEGGRYYTVPSGWTLTGLQNIDGRTYYLDPADYGKAFVGFKDIDGIKRLFNANGDMAKGWGATSTNWYYADPSTGAIRTGWLNLSGIWYYLDPSNEGVMVTGIQIINGSKYSFNGSGAMATGWWSHEGGRYYTVPSGWTLTGWHADAGKWYYLDPANYGRMMTGLIEVNGLKSYLGSDGVMATGWVWIDGRCYYFDASGYMQTSKWIGSYWVDETGAWIPNQVVTPIMGSSSVSAQQLADIYSRVVGENTYPYRWGGNSTYSSEAPNILKYCEFVISEAKAEGVMPEVVFMQCMLETNWLRFGGDVKADQFNFAGLGATGNGVPGERFPSVRIGIRAHVQHLKAYASTKPLNNALVDERFHYVSRGCAPYVEWLGQQENPDGKGWATSKNYGYNIVDMLKRYL